MKKAIRILSTILVLSIAAALYCLIAAPLLEPLSQYKKVNKSNNAFEITNPQILALFGSDDWELKKAQRYKLNRQHENGDYSTYYFFVKNYSFQKNNTIELNKCTVVIINSSKPNSALIIRCDGKFTCYFEQAIKLSSLFSNDPASNNRFLGGDYVGKVSVVSKGDGENLSFETHDFRIGRGNISTNAIVNFRYGRTQGVGSGMKIQFISHGLFGSIRDFSYKISNITIQKLQRLTIVPPADKQNNVQNNNANLFNAPIDLRCDGMFEFNVLKKEASFRENVSLIQTVSNKAPNSIRCQLLKLHFASANHNNIKKDAADSASKTDTDAQFNDWNLQLERLEATGSAVVIEAPEYQTKIYSSKLIANLSPLSFEIDSPTQCEFYYKNHYISTPNMVYKIGKKGTLGTLECSSGWIRSQMKQEGKQIRARWSEGLLLEPDPNDQSESIVSIQGSALMELENNNKSEASITAESISFWLTQKENSSTSNGFGELTLSRMLANKNVVLKSNPITALVKTIQLWFEDGENKEISRPVESSVQTSNVQSDPDALLSTPSSYRVSGDLLQGKISLKQDQLQIQELTLKDDIRVVQSSLDSNSGDKAGKLEMSGSQIQIFNLTEPSASASLIGQPAMIRYNNATITGDAIHVNRGINRIWINSRGDALFKPSDDNLNNGIQIAESESETSNENISLATAAKNSFLLLPARINWSESMVFQDDTITFNGGISIERKGQNVQCESLSIVLNKKIDFQNLNSTELQNSLNVRYVILNNSIDLTNDTVENGVLVARDTLNASKLTIDMKNQRFVAEGPGQAKTQRKHPGLSEKSAVDANGDPPQNSLIHLNVDFQKRLEGLYAPNSLSTFTFSGRVDAYYSPIDKIGKQVKSSSLSGAPPEAFSLKCNKMEIQTDINKIAQSETLEGQKENNDSASRFGNSAFIASGSVSVEGRVYNAHADKITYEAKNNMMTLEGDGQIPAQFFYQKVSGGHYSQATSATIYYNTKTGAVKGEGMQDFTLFLSPKSSSE